MSTQAVHSKTNRHTDAESVVSVAVVIDVFQRLVVHHGPESKNAPRPEAGHAHNDHRWTQGRCKHSVEESAIPSMQEAARW